jgi:beta-lactamase superfamily II metal-dependent hydrolase
MAIRFSDRKTQAFRFRDNGKERRYVLIYGDEVETLPGASFKGARWAKVRYRGRIGAIRKYASGSGPARPDLRDERTLEMYFLDVGQGDAAFLVTPNNTKILVDGGIKITTTEFLIWKYRLDDTANRLTIDHLFLSHADSDHVKGLIPLLNHPRIDVTNIWHNGIGVFDSGFNEALGNVANHRLTTLHDSTGDLDGLNLSATFGKWIAAVKQKGSNYRALDASTGVLDIGDSSIQIEILGPVRNSDGSLDWFGDKAHTINGHSLVFRLTHDFVRTFFSGDLNVDGAELLMSAPGAALRLDSHILKSPHHGSHEFHQPFFDAVRPMVSVVSSGDSPDHGHPRAAFLGGLARAGRGDLPLVFATEIAATFVDAGDDASLPEPPPLTGEITALSFATAKANSEARRRFKKALPGIINLRSNGHEIYAARRVRAGYQWESYGPVEAES